VQVTSNKSLIGHTGWAAGVVSLIHALLALQHSRIPAQHRFNRAPDTFGLAATNLTVPTEPVPWPARPDRPRAAGVSGFGFGGTNAHLLVQEYRPGHPYRPYGRHRDADAVIVGWSAHLPGVGDLEQVAQWASAVRDVPESFGRSYPRPSFQRLRLPAGAVRATDRTQLMIVECMQRLAQPVRALCDRHRDRAGVVVGHTGPTRNATLYALRAYLDELDRAAAAQDDSEQLTELLKELRQYATEQVDAPTEDSFPGEMPNVIAARLCNYFDLRGLSITVDASDASLPEAFVTAGRYLEFGDLEVALVAGVSGNSLPSWRALAVGSQDIGEGAFMFAVTTRAIAQAEGLPALAELAGAADRMPIAELAGTADRTAAVP
jgi:3-oxoacyl-(acyl-carrier-protein) synthase